MVSLKEHIAFLRTLKIPYKGTLIQYLYDIFNQHSFKPLFIEVLGSTVKQQEDMTLENFIKEVTRPEPTEGEHG